jgi:ribosomal protein L22
MATTRDTEENEKIVIYYQGKYLQLKARKWKKIAEQLRGAAISPAKAVIEENKKVKFVPAEKDQPAGIGGYSVVLNLDALLPKPPKPRKAPKRGKKAGKTPKKPA